MELELGQIVLTLGAEAVLEKGESADLLNRHKAGDYGNVSHVDACINDFAVEDGGGPITSVYRTRKGFEVLVITEAPDASGHRPCTKIALPQEVHDEPPKRA